MRKLMSVLTWLAGLSLVIAAPMVAAAQPVGGARPEDCPQGRYYAPALGGYVLLPARYVPYATDLEPGMTGSYRSPAPPMFRRCPLDQLADAAGTIETGTVTVMKVPGRLPTHKPQTITRSGEFQVTIWRASFPKDTARERTTVLITKGNAALRLFDADAELWRRLLDSYFSG